MNNWIQKVLVASLLTVATLFSMWMNDAQASTTGTDMYLNLTGGWITIWTTGSINFGTMPIASVDVPISAQFSSYAWVQDLNWLNSWYYTTVQSSDLVWPNWTIPASSIQMRIVGGIVNLIAGNANSLVVLWPSMGTAYTLIDTAKVFMKRDWWTNNGVTGKYGVLPEVQVTIPAFQAVWQYTGRLTITLIEN